MGGGGSSTSGAQGQGVNAVGGNEVQAGAAQSGMALQTAMMQSQVELNKANAKKAEADAIKTAGVDTKQVESLTELAKNQNLTEQERKGLLEVQQELTWSEKALTDQKASTEVQNQGRIFHETEYLKKNVEEAGKRIDGLTIDNEVKERIKNAVVEKAYADVSDIYSQMLLRSKQGALTEEQIKRVLS